MASEEKKTPFQELSDVAEILFSLSEEDFKKVGLSYFDAFRDLFIFHLTESLWVYVIAKTKEPPIIGRTPSLSDALKSAVGQDKGSKNVSFQTFFDSIKENVILKPFSLILQKVLDKLKDGVLKLEIEYKKSKNDRNKMNLEGMVRDIVQGIPEVTELRKKIEETMGGKRKRKRTRRRRKRRKTKRTYKGGNLEPSPQISALIKSMCDKEVNLRFN